MTRRMRLFAFDFQGPAHLSAGLWRHEQDKGHRYKDLRYWTDYAQLLEQARFDGIFFADNVGYHDVYEGNADAALADAAARNLGTGQQVPHDERYDMAAEYLEVCYKLWEGSWEDDAVVRDRVNGVYADPRRVHDIAHHGTYFTVPGFHLCEPSPQRTPVIFQAGGSSKGQRLAASSAEGGFVNAVSIPALKRQGDKLHELAAEAGRDPQNVKVLQMLNVVCAPTDEAAHAKFEEYRKLVSYSGAMARYSGWTGLDMSQFDPDVPLRHVKTNAGQTMVDLFSKMDPDKEWTPPDIAEFVGIGGTGPTIVGSPTTVADELTRWMDETGIAGYNLAHAVRYQDIADFIELVVPELQRRGTMWSEYEGSTLREKLYGPGAVRLRDDHPGHRFATPAVEAAR